MSYKLRSLRLRKGIAHKLNLPKCASLSLWCAKDLTRNGDRGAKLRLPEPSGA